MLPVWYGCLEATDTYLYEDSESELVVEGRITNAKPPYFVRITKSVSPKFENNSLAIVSAKVVIADETGFEEQLTGIGNGYYMASSIQGNVDNEYYIDIEYDGKTIRAADHIMQPPLFDSVGIRQLIGVKGNGEYVVLYGEKGSKSKYFYKVELTVNGVKSQAYSSIYLFEDISVQNNQEFVIPELFNSGDSVLVEVHSITEQIYEYFRGLNKQVDNLYGNVQAPLLNPPSNVSGALGYFMASAVWSDTIVVK